jgi:hypothetical protein
LIAGKQREDHQQHKRNGENVETGHERISLASEASLKRSAPSCKGCRALQGG